MAKASVKVETPNFGSILDRPSEGGKRPPPLPVGTYNTLIKGLPRYGKSDKKGTDFVEFTHQFVQAYDDVSEEDLNTALTKPSGEVVKLSDRTIRNTYYLTEDAKWRVERFLKHCGLDEADFESIRQMIDATPGRQVAITIKHTPSDDGEDLYANIAGTAAVA
jgi:hypothetical protein